MVDSDTSAHLRMLRDAVRLLAAPKDAQLQGLRELGVPDCIDELALGLSDVWGPGSVLDPYLSAEATALLTELDRVLDEMSGSHNERLWCVGALSDPSWERVRVLAQQTYELLAEA